MIYLENFFVCVTARKLGDITSTFMIILIQNISSDHVLNMRSNRNSRRITKHMHNLGNTTHY